MIRKSLLTLAANPPPRSKPILNARQCNERIRELEIQLGIPKGQDYWNIGKANARVKELETMLTQPVATPSTPAPTAPTGPVEITPGTLAACAQAVFGTFAASSYEGQRLQFTRAGLTVPGLKASPASEHYAPKFTGLARAVRADRQSKISKFFESKG